MPRTRDTERSREPMRPRTGRRFRRPRPEPRRAQRRAICAAYRTKETP